MPLKEREERLITFSCREFGRVSFRSQDICLSWLCVRLITSLLFRPSSSFLLCISRNKLPRYASCQLNFRAYLYPHPGCIIGRERSSLSKYSLSLSPREYPPSEPFFRTTRWHGVKSGTGLARIAEPTALAGPSSS